MREVVIDALRCPTCKDVVCSHRHVGTEYHVPRCCGQVLTIFSEWDPVNHRWVVKVGRIPEQEWDEIDDVPF